MCWSVVPASTFFLSHSTLCKWRYKTAPTLPVQPYIWGHDVLVRFGIEFNSWQPPSTMQQIYMSLHSIYEINSYMLQKILIQFSLFVMSCRFSPAVLIAAFCMWGPCIRSYQHKSAALPPWAYLQSVPRVQAPWQSALVRFWRWCASLTEKAAINHDASAEGSEIRDASLPHSTNWTKSRERRERK